MHLGIYRFAGDPQDLLTAYDRLMAGMPKGQILFQTCVVLEDGITVYDACPTEEAFRGWVPDPRLADAFAAAGLPQPTIDDAAVHSAFVDGEPFPAGSG